MITSAAFRQFNAASRANVFQRSAHGASILRAPAVALTSWRGLHASTQTLAESKAKKSSTKETASKKKKSDEPKKSGKCFTWYPQSLGLHAGLVMVTQSGPSSRDLFRFHALWLISLAFTETKEKKFVSALDKKALPKNHQSAWMLFNHKYCQVRQMDQPSLRSPH